MRETVGLLKNKADLQKIQAIWNETSYKKSYIQTEIIRR